MGVVFDPLLGRLRTTDASGSGSGDVTHTGTLTAHEVILGNGGADIKALGAIGALGEVLTSGGAGVDPSWQPAGSGSIGGTIAATQVAFGTGVDTIGGDVGMTYDVTIPSFYLESVGASDSVLNTFFTAGGSNVGNYMRGSSVDGTGITVVEADVRISTMANAAALNTSFASDLRVTTVNVTEAIGFYGYTPTRVTGGTITTYIGFYQGDLASVATNGYYQWADSQGVYRILEDAVADTASFPQAVTALYNPRFTKYTPGAANRERLVQQWVGNVATITTEAGGTGTLRALNLGGSSVTANGVVIATVTDIANVNTLAWLGL